MTRNHRWEPGSCVGCGQGTDTGYALLGSRDWHARFLRLWEADPEVVEQMLDDLPDLTEPIYHRLCAQCAQRVGLPRPGLLVDPNGVTVAVEPKK